MSIVSFVVSFAMRLNWSIVSCVVSFTMRLNCSKNSNQSFNVNPAIYVCNNWSDVVQCHILKYTSHYSLGKQTGQWSEKGVLIRHMTSHMTSIKPNDVIKFTSPLSFIDTFSIGMFEQPKLLRPRKCSNKHLFYHQVYLF